jgi:GNAT superfamily N-acetyltransferase
VRPSRGYYGKEMEGGVTRIERTNCRQSLRVEYNSEPRNQLLNLVSGRYHIRMTSKAIRYSETRDVPLEGVLALYRANEWSSAQKGETLQKALLASHSLVTAWDGEILVGVGNAISDGYLVVYYPHLLVLPGYQGRGIGTRLMEMLMAHYKGFHQHMLVADGRALDFYRKCGFDRAGKTEPMWIYAGHDH